MAGLKVYVDMMSQPSRALVMFLKCNKIPYETKVTAIAKGEHKSESFLKINPFGKVPAIEDNGFNLIESVAILRYLARKNNVADHWYPKDTLKQARVDEFIEWQHIGLRFPASAFFFHSFLLPMLQGKPADQKELSLWKSKAEESFGLIESVWLKNSKYLTGEEISIADLLALCEIEQTLLTGCNPSENRPKLSAWINRCHTELSPHYDEVHKIFNKVLEKSKASKSNL